MNKKQKKKLTLNIIELQKILNSFELIPDCPNDEFDALNHQIISLLYKGSSSEKVAKVVQNELTIYYGLSIENPEALEIVEKIFNWWNNQNLKC